MGRNHTKSDALTLLFWTFPPLLLCLPLRAESLGQRREHAIDVSHCSMILRMNRYSTTLAIRGLRSNKAVA
jgi:hypothetical protein